MNRKASLYILFSVIAIFAVFAIGLMLYLKHYSKVFTSNYLSCKYFVDNGDYDAAEEYCLTAINMKPDYVPARINLGIAYFHQGMLDKAQFQFRHAITGSGSNIYNKAVVYYNLGEIYSKEMNINYAWSSYKKAYRLFPSLFKKDKQEWLLSTIASDDKKSFAQIVNALKDIASIKFKVTEGDITGGGIEIIGGRICKDDITGFSMEIYPDYKIHYSGSSRLYASCGDITMVVSAHPASDKDIENIVKLSYLNDKHGNKLPEKVIQREMTVGDGFKLYSKVVDDKTWRKFENLLILDGKNIWLSIFFNYPSSIAGKEEPRIKTMLSSIKIGYYHSLEIGQ